MSRELRIAFCLVAVGALMAGSLALADKPPKPDCKWTNLQCPPDWDPVYCEGTLYNNRCFAKQACVKHCKKFPSA